ncbi:hypothetical protein VNO78_12463 [Psophocarpus tetragonolobus]|uniref:Uncharacterized protein n=1 Tax=Psophocarpus tetragonolobus TaxID=3891 RepID=A0AAN9SN21_PSOTE
MNFSTYNWEHQVMASTSKVNPKGYQMDIVLQVVIMGAHIVHTTTSQNWKNQRVVVADRSTGLRNKEGMLNNPVRAVFAPQSEVVYPVILERLLQNWLHHPKLPHYTTRLISRHYVKAYQGSYQPLQLTARHKLQRKSP